FQSQNRKEFEQLMTQALEAWESAGALFERSALPGSSKRALSRACYARFWLEKNSEARRELAKRCVSLGEETLLAFDSGDKTSVAESRGELLSYLRSANELADNYQDLNESFEKAVRVGRETIRDLSSLSLDNALLEALVTTFWFLTVRSHIIVEPNKLPDLQKEAKLLAGKVH